MDCYSDKCLPVLDVCEEQVSGFLAEKSSLFAPCRFQKRPPSPWRAVQGWGSREAGPPSPSDSPAGPCLAASWQTSRNHPARHREQRPVREDTWRNQGKKDWKNKTVSWKKFSNSSLTDTDINIWSLNNPVTKKKRTLFCVSTLRLKNQLVSALWQTN